MGHAEQSIFKQNSADFYELFHFAMYDCFLNEAIVA